MGWAVAVGGLGFYRQAGAWRSQGVAGVAAEGVAGAVEDAGEGGLAGDGVGDRFGVERKGGGIVAEAAGGEAVGNE